jgi:anti-anti-sigma factor
VPVVPLPVAPVDAAERPDACTCPTIQIQVQGEVDTSTIPRLRERLNDALTLQPVHLYVDLGECTFIGASGVSMLLDAHRKARRQQASLVLRSCGARHLRVLALMGLKDVFDIEGSATPCR